MKLTTVLGSVNLNPHYFLFIPKQIEFWKLFNIRFIAILVADKIPNQLINYTDHIILWDKNTTINPVFIAQNIRMYYPALIKLPDDEMIMITDIDMLPLKPDYYTTGLDDFSKDDFIYYRSIQNKMVSICYNAAHPDTWKKVFQIYSTADIEKRITDTYSQKYVGLPEEAGWFTDQEILYNQVMKYPQFRILNRKIKRLEMIKFMYFIRKEGNAKFITQYDDCHFHRSYYKFYQYIKKAQLELIDSLKLKNEKI